MADCRECERAAWNTRPIEDALRARAEAAEVERDEARARVAELEERWVAWSSMQARIVSGGQCSNPLDAPAGRARGGGAVMRRETIGNATLILGDSRDVCLETKHAAIITDPVWPNVPDGMFPLDCHPEYLLRDVLSLHCHAKRLVVVMRHDSDPRFLAYVPPAFSYFRTCILEYACPGHIGRKLGGMELAYCFGNPITCAPGQRTIPGKAVQAQPDRTKIPNPHPCPRNVDHMRWLVRWFSEPTETVFDPFMGSGTTGVAAVQLGRQFVGIEVNPQYYAYACERLRAAQQQGRLF